MGGKISERSGGVQIMDHPQHTVRGHGYCRRETRPDGRVCTVAQIEGTQSTVVSRGPADANQQPSALRSSLLVPPEHKYVLHELELLPPLSGLENARSKERVLRQQSVSQALLIYLVLLYLYIKSRNDLQTGDLFSSLPFTINDLRIYFFNAAFINSLNNGCGLIGLDLNSG